MKKLLIVSLLIPMAAQQASAEPKIVTLTCEGTADLAFGEEKSTDKGHKTVQEPMGVVVNFDERTVSFLEYAAPITESDAAQVKFAGQQTKSGSNDDLPWSSETSISGDIDRVTGIMEATISRKSKSQPEPPQTYTYTDTSRLHLRCKTTDRVF